MLRFALAVLALATPVFAQTAGDPATPAQIEPARPNFVLVMADDVSVGDLPIYGNPIVKAPNLERMAREGVVFENLYLTASSCSPSRCSILTGRYPHNTGAPELHQGMGPEQVLFTTVLRDAGYYTAMAGKNHLYEASKRGFELVINRDTGPGGGKQWVQILADRPKDKPFFLYASAWDAHRPWQKTDEAPKYRAEEAVIPPYIFDGFRTREDFADFYHEISRLDVYLGRIIDELERQGVADNTYVIYMADNGRPFPRDKTRLYDSGIKSPFVVWKGKSLRAARTPSLVSALDIAPTVLQLAGVKAPPTVQGVSFASVLDDPRTTTRDYVFAEHNWHSYPAHQRMVRSGKYVYILNSRTELPATSKESDTKFPAGQELKQAFDAGKLAEHQKDVFLVPRPREEMYDVEADPHQLDNIVGRADVEGDLAHLRDALKRWMDETGDTVPDTLTQFRKPDGTLVPPPDDDSDKSAKIVRGETPGAARNAKSINNRGPVRR